VSLLKQYLDLDTSTYGGSTVMDVRTQDVAPIVQPSNDLVKNDRRDAPPVWPNPACKAWTPSPDYLNPPLYTPSQRLIRDKTPWTLVQAILAPLQFLVFLVSLGLVTNYLITGAGYAIATYSVVAKTLILYVIMITGSIWEKVVFDEWLFAEPFFWEDVFSMVVLGLQTLYLCALIFGWWSPDTQLKIALAAYATYVINAAQFIWKLRMARLEAGRDKPAVVATS
jgi:3-vinyl bacteriochlorophyllide hydratase